MSDPWYYAKNKQRSGPVSLDQLRKMAESGQLSESDLVWCKGMAAWAPAKTVPDLFAEVPPPLPDDAEIPPLEAEEHPDATLLDSLLERANTLLDSDAYEEAATAFDDALKTDPKSVKALLGRGISHSMLDDEEVAIDAFSQAIALDPLCGNAYRERASALKSLERYEEALADADKAVAISPTDVVALLICGETKRLLQRHDEACADFTSVIRIDPQLYSGWYERGKSLSLAGKDVEAIPDLKRALTLCDDEAIRLRITYWLAVAHHDGGDPATAVTLFEQLKDDDDVPDWMREEINERLDQCRSDFISAGDGDVVVAEENQGSDETQETPSAAVTPAPPTLPPPTPAMLSPAMPPPTPPAPQVADPIQDGIKAIGGFFAGLTTQGQSATPTARFAAAQEALKGLGGFFHKTTSAQPPPPPPQPPQPQPQPQPPQPQPPPPQPPPSNAPPPASRSSPSSEPTNEWRVKASKRLPALTITNEVSTLRFENWRLGERGYDIEAVVTWNPSWLNTADRFTDPNRGLRTFFEKDRIDTGKFTVYYFDKDGVVIKDSFLLGPSELVKGQKAKITLLVPENAALIVIKTKSHLRR